MKTDKVKILIVEDARIWAQQVMNKFNKLNIDYDWVKNGRDAVHKIQEKMSYQAIIMDLQMPVMDGLEATQKIRKLGFKAPIIGHSSIYGMTYILSQCQDAGMDICLSKGLTTDPLIKVLYEWKIIGSLERMKRRS